MAIAVLAIVGTTVIGLGFIRPSVPLEWNTVAVGMSRDEVLKRIPDTLADMRSEKGFDVATREIMQWGFRKCHWQLLLTYDSNGLVRTVETSFTDPHCGLYNTVWSRVDQATSNQPAEADSH